MTETDDPSREVFLIILKMSAPCQKFQKTVKPSALWARLEIPIRRPPNHPPTQNITARLSPTIHMCFLRELSWQFESYLETQKLSNKFSGSRQLCCRFNVLLWSLGGVVLLLSDSSTRVRRQFETTPSRLFASGHSFIMSNQEFVDQRLTGQDL